MVRNSTVCPPDNFEPVLGPAGWRVGHVGTPTYLRSFKPEKLDYMQQTTGANPNMGKRFPPLQEQLKVIGPLLDKYRGQVPISAVVATRRDY